MADQVEVTKTVMEADVKSLVKGLNSANSVAQNLDKTLVDILTHLTAVENGMSKVGNKNFNNSNYYDLNSSNKVVKSSKGFMSSNTGREKLYKEYQQAVIDETKEITADIAERKKFRKQRADAETQRARNESTRISKIEDQNSAAYQARMNKLAEAKLLNARNGQAGALNRNWRYQGGKMLDAVGTAANQFGVGGRIIGDILGTAGAALKAPAAGVMTIFTKLGQGMIDFSKAATQAYAEIESIKTQLGVVFSNQTQADSMFGQISQYAVKSPFGIQQTSELAVLLKQSGVYASDLMDTLRMIGDTAGGNMEKMKRIANNYAQIVSIGKASMLDMRQFAYAGIPIFEAVSKELGVSQQELRKLISDGKVTSDIIEKVFKDLTGINGLFENATAKGAKTLKARLQNLQDAKQLAMSSAGEFIVNYGTQTGNDSWVNNLVTTAENLYQYMQEKVSTVNIEKSVEAIEKRENRISDLVKMTEKYSDNPKMLAIMTRALGVELSKRDIDRERAIYEASYQNKTKLAENTYKDFGVESFHELEQLAAIISKRGKMYYESPSAGAKPTQMAMDRFAESHGLNLNEIYGMPRDEFNTLTEVIKEAVDAIKDSKQITEQEIRYHNESNLLAAQQLAFDQENKRADQTSSLNSKFQELLEIYKASDEYKQREEEKKTKTLAEAQETLKKLVPKADSSGLVDLRKFSMLEFQKYDAQGAFTPGKRFNVVQGNNPTNAEDMKALRSQFSYAMTEASKYLNLYDSRTADALAIQLKDLNSNLSDSDYINKFSETFTAVRDLMNVAKVPDNVKNQVLSWITSSTLSHELTVGGQNADLSKQDKGKELQEFIPLWKRIIASDTGWSAERITTAKDFMKEYQKYSAQQIARGGIQGLANVGMRAGEIGSMLSYTSGVNKQGVRQVDWEKTEQNIYKYALALETPLKRSSAAMTGLADAMKNQVDTYRKLTADIYTVGEDWTTINNDIKGQYSVAQGLGNANILDNAFEAFAKETDGFKVQFDEKQGLVVFDKLSNTIVGSVADLKASSDIKDENLKKYLEGIKVDNLVTALDEATRQIEINSQVTQVEAEMLNEATKLEAKRLESRVNTYGQSGIVLGALKGSRNEDIAAESLGFTSRNDKSAEYQIGKEVNDAITNMLKKISEMDNIQLSKDEFMKSTFGDSLSKQKAINDIRDALNDPNTETFENAIQLLITAFPEVIQRILEEARRTTDAIKNDESTAAADKALREMPLSIFDPFYTNASFTGNSPFGQNMVEALGSPLVKFESLLEDMTKAVLANPSDNTLLTDKYTSNLLDSVKKEGKRGNLSPEEVAEFESEISKLASNEDFKAIKEFLEGKGQGDIWKSATESANKLALSLGNVGRTLENISEDAIKLGETFASDLFTSSFTTWGEALGKSEDASKALARNLAQMNADMLKNLGTMLTQAGLSLAISSIGDKAGVLAGLAIAAAGGGLSFLGGYISGALSEENESKKDSEYEKLLKIKQDLSDLLKQAREDAIYYENNVRHKKALSANDEFTTRSVHDAIITPQGQVVTTDPKDYLIATKTPKTLVGGGAPTINFSVIDKSTGITVTQQKSTYNEATNSIDFEAVIESKVQEIIATSKGDDAFAARQARLNGRTVIA